MSKKKKKADIDWEARLKEMEQKIPTNKISIREEEPDAEPYQDPEKPALPAKKKPRNKLIEVPRLVDEGFDSGKTEEEIEVDLPAHILARQIIDGEKDPVDLTTDERFIIVRHLIHEEHYSADECAELLRVSRRTVQNYKRKIKEYDAKQLATETVWTIGGEIRDLGKKASLGALAAGKFKAALEAKKIEIELLQNLGILYKRPSQSQSQIQQQISQDVKISSIQDYQNQVAGEEVNLEHVLNELLESVEQGKLEEKPKDDDKDKG